MAKIDFPVATSDGQVFNAPSGVKYTYIGTPPAGYWSAEINTGGGGGGGAVDSVNSKTGVVILDATDVGAATTAQGVTADTATQPGDDISTLNNDANYITSTEADALPYVETTGDNMSGDLTLGTDKITLDASDGNITADGDVYSSDSFQLGAGINRSHKIDVTNGNWAEAGINIKEFNSNGAEYTRLSITGKGPSDSTAVFDGSITAAGGKINLYPSGNIGSSRDDGSIVNINAGSVRAIQVADRTDSSIKFSVDHDGSITAAGGNVTISDDGAILIDRDRDDKALINGYKSSTRTYRLTADGTTEIGGSITDDSSNAPNIELKSDGSITAAGEIQVSETDATIEGVRVMPKGKIILNGSGDALVINSTTGLGNPKIQLEANGGITAAGSIISTYGVYAGVDEDAGSTKQGALIGSNGSVKASRPTGGNPLWYGYTTGNATPTSYIYANGSAMFAGTVTAKGVDSTTVFRAEQTNADQTKIELKADGSALFSTTVFAGDSSNVGTGLFAATNNASAATPAITARNYNAGNGGLFTGYNSTGSINVNITSDGSATFSGTVTATVVPPSDARFKENITPAKPQLADVVALGGLLKNYDWNDDAPLSEELRSQRQLGLIAQEVAEVCPSIVKDINATKTMEVTPAVVGPKGKVVKEAVTEEVDDSYKGISQDALIMKLIGAVAELKAELDILKSA